MWRTFPHPALSGRAPTVEDRGWVVKEGVVGAEEQVGAVAPGAQIEEKLPGALRHLGGISRLEATPLGQGLRVRRWVAISAGGQGPGTTPPGRRKPGSGALQAGQCWGGPGV